MKKKMGKEQLLQEGKGQTRASWAAARACGVSADLNSWTMLVSTSALLPGALGTGAGCPDAMHARCRRFSSDSSRFCLRMATVASSRFLRLSVAVSSARTPFLSLFILCVCL